MPLDQPEEMYPYEKNMGFFDHIDELRKRLFRVAVVVLIGTVVGFVYVEKLFEWIVLSPFSPDFFGYRFFCKAGHTLLNSDAMCWTPPPLVMQSQQIQGQFVSAFKIAFVVGFVVAFPYIIYQIWSFVKPALSQKEIQKTGRSLSVVSLLFFTGLFFAYFFLVPLASNFLLGYSLNPQIQNIITISSVTGFVTFMSLATGLVFELPVLIYVLAKLGIVSSAFLKKNWRYAVVVIFLIAGIATPSPDVFSQLLLGTPLMGLYVVGIYVAKRVEKIETMSNKTIALGSDHAGFELKNEMIVHLIEQGFELIDMGPDSADSVDYPDYAHKVGEAVENGDAGCGILICGSGNGVCITANKHNGVRAALCWEPEISALAKQHNNANVICLPARFVSQEKAFAIVDAYLGAEFEGGRHQNRVSKIEG